MSCTDKKLKSKTLQGLVQLCGLSASGMGVRKLKILLKSLRQHRLPRCAKSVTIELVNTHKLKPGGDGFRSAQQRAFRLLTLMDPTLGEALGKKEQIKTGDYVWCEDKRVSLAGMIRARLDKWVRARPPFGYNEAKAKDMWFWETLRNAGLKWANSTDAIDFAIVVYKLYAVAFSEAIDNADRFTVDKCLESFFTKRRNAEKGVIHEETVRRLMSIVEGDVAVVTQGRNIVDCFSFVVREMLGGVFDFFKSQVRVRDRPVMSRRFKDREDMAKTYYLCGCVYHSVHNIVERRKGKDTDRQLLCLETLCVDSDTAAKQGLPTRHVTLKTGGGLVFASKGFYEVFSQMEDFFYCTVGPHRHTLYTHHVVMSTCTPSCPNPQVTMRANFGMPDVDIISTIGQSILDDENVRSSFCNLLPPEDRVVFGQDFFEEFVKRLQTMHGTELAAQLTERLASLKRSKDARKRNRLVEVNAKHEQLRAVKKKRKIMRTQHKRVDVDLTAVPVSTHHTHIGENLELHFKLGEQVTAIEGTGSSTRQYQGTVTEIDLDGECYIVLCQGVHGYRHGYNMLVPFSDSKIRMNQPVHTTQRKRIPKIMFY